MKQGKLVDYLFIAFWAVVLVITLMNKMMLAMDLMAIGMLLSAIRCGVKK